MIVKNISEFTNGWFIGNFDPSIFKNEYFEVAHHRHPAGYKTPKHTHKIAREAFYVYGVTLTGNVGLSERAYK